MGCFASRKRPFVELLPKALDVDSDWFRASALPALRSERSWKGQAPCAEGAADPPDLQAPNEQSKQAELYGFRAQLLDDALLGGLND